MPFGEGGATCRKVGWVGRAWALMVVMMCSASDGAEKRLKLQIHIALRREEFNSKLWGLYFALSAVKTNKVVQSTMRRAREVLRQKPGVQTDAGVCRPVFRDPDGRRPAYMKRGTLA